MPITAVHSNEAMDDGLPSAETEVPAWMANRRERRISEAAQDVSAAKDASAAEDAEAPTPDLVFASITQPPPIPRTKAKAKPLLFKKSDPDAVKKLIKKIWWLPWISNHGLIGIAVSMLIHAFVLGALAFIIMSSVSREDDVQIWGNSGDSDEVGGDVLIDTTVDSDPGESAPMQMADMGQVFDTIGVASQASEAMRVGTGGHGNGIGQGGEGNGTGGMTLNVPGHAQTKGSFSAWTEPRDPQPLQNYNIVIQIRLPRNVKKYRAADLSGLVTGTDKFRQEIRYKPGETFEIKDGTVEVRIFVPGGAERVRDTIRIESKMLREKQTFEIEF